MENQSHKEKLQSEFEKFFKICEVCDLLSDEINKRYLYAFLRKGNYFNHISEFFNDGVRITAKLSELETAYRIATADYFKQSNKLIAMLNADN